MLRIMRGRHRARRLLLPPREIVRPMGQRMRESLFNILEHRYHYHWEKVVVLDAFAGSGSLGLEALSRGAQHVYFIENHPHICQFLKKNSANDGRATVLRVNATQPYTLNHQADLIFVDPPFGENLLPAGVGCALAHAKTTATIVVQKETNVAFLCPGKWHVDATRTHTYKQLLFLRKTPAMVQRQENS